MSFFYTDAVTDFNSSAVDEAYYDKASGSLVVVLKGGSGYDYSNVPLDVWNDLISPNHSAGREYALNIKPNYGPGAYLGYFNPQDSYFVKTAPAVDMPHSQPAVGTPKNLNFANATDSSKTTVYNLYAEPVVGDKSTLTHIVEFEVDGKTREYSLETTGLDEALSAIQEIASMLDLDFKVKSVKVIYSE